MTLIKDLEAAGVVRNAVSQYNSPLCWVVKETYNGLLLSELSCCFCSSGCYRLCNYIQITQTDSTWYAVLDIPGSRKVHIMT